MFITMKKKIKIFMVTTPEEADELKEEGIEVASIPWVDKTKLIFLLRLCSLQSNQHLS